MDELANVTALYNEAKTEISQANADKDELDELREMKSDIERKDKQNAMIIESQVGRHAAVLEPCKTQSCSAGYPAAGGSRSGLAAMLARLLCVFSFTLPGRMLSMHAGILSCHWVRRA